MTIEEIKERIRLADYPEAIAVLDEYIAAHPDDDVALTVRGLRHWGASKRSLAINDFLAAIRLNPESRAKEALKAANEVLDFYNKDLFNP